MLERVWDNAHEALKHGYHPEPTTVELCSALEHALNFMHTGNVSVIATSAMNPLWIGLSVILDGHPCINPTIVPSLTSTRLVNDLQWPRNNKGQPTSASRGAQIRTYSQGHFNVSCFLLFSFLYASKKPQYQQSPTCWTLSLFSKITIPTKFNTLDFVTFSITKIPQLDFAAFQKSRYHQSKY